MAERRRRGHGEGSIYQVSGGQWRGALDLGWVDGKRRRRYITRKTRAAVVRELGRLASSKESGQIQATRPPRLDDWLDRYLAEVATGSVRVSTLARYEQEARLHLKPAFGRLRLDELKPSDISAFYVRLGATLAPASIRRLHAFFRRSLTVAVRWGLIPQNPASMVDPPPLTGQPPSPLDRKDTARFIRGISGTRLEARWLIAIVLGMRQGEVLGLWWSDVDLDTNGLFVRRALQRQAGGALVFVSPKTARSRRFVPMTEEVAAALERWQDRQKCERESAGDLWVESDLIFTTAVGTPINPRNDHRAFKTLLSRLDLPTVRLHDLRHTAASRMLESGMQPRVVMELLGHSQIGVTMNTYTHVETEVSTEAIRKLGRMLRVDQEDQT